MKIDSKDDLSPPPAHFIPAHLVISDNPADSLLYEACFTGNIELLEQAIRGQANINVLLLEEKKRTWKSNYKSKFIPLKIAMKNGQEQIALRLLLENSINSEPEITHELIKSAIYYQCHSVLAHLLDKIDCSMSDADSRGYTLLMHACEAKNNQAVLTFLKRGADVNQIVKEKGLGAKLYHALHRCEFALETMTLLLEHGANPFILNHSLRLTYDSGRYLDDMRAIEAAQNDFQIFQQHIDNLVASALSTSNGSIDEADLLKQISDSLYKLPFDANLYLQRNFIRVNKHRELSDEQLIAICLKPAMSRSFAKLKAIQTENIGFFQTQNQIVIESENPELMEIEEDDMSTPLDTKYV